MTGGEGGFTRGLKWAFVMNWGQRTLGTAFTFVLAALLGPHDFGVVAMALVYIALVQLLLEQGTSTAVIQREGLEPEHLDSAFWLNLAWCLVLTGASIAVSGWWADANDTPLLEPVLIALSAMVVLSGLNIVQQAIFERELRFKELALRANVAALVGGTTGVALAVAGAGVWALVAQQLVTQSVAVVALWSLSPWRPGLRFSRSHARSLLGFSADVFAANVAGFLNRRADALLMGIFFGPVAVGLYRLADRLVDTILEITMRPVGLVSLPVFSRLQNDREGLREAVTSCIRITLLVTVPTICVVAACGEYILAVIGPEWTVAADALAILALVGMAKALSFFTGPLLFAVARPRLRAVMLWCLAAVSAGTVVVTAAALAGHPVQDQIFGLASSRAVFFLLVVIPVNLFVVARITGLRLRSLVPAVPAPVLSGLAGIGAVALVRVSGAPDGLPSAVALILVGAAGSAAAAAVLVLAEPSVRARALPLWRRVVRRPARPAPV